MREASFSPGVVASVVIAFVMWVVYSIVREIPAGFVDTANYMPLVSNHYHYITKPSTMLVSLSLTAILVTIVLLYVKRVEQRPLSTIGLSRRHALPRFGFGFLLGTLLLVAYATLELTTWSFSYSGFKPVALLFIPAFILQAASEEMLYRGYLLSSLTAKTGVVSAVLLSSAVFTFLRIGDHGTNVLNMTILFLMAVLAALLTIRTGSLWAACGLHAAWSFTKGLAFTTYYGNLHTSYALFSMKFLQFDRGVRGDWEVLPVIPLAVIMIVLVLFAGKNRLITRPTEEEQAYFLALGIAKAALASRKDDFSKPYIRHATGVADMLDSGDERIAALLAVACNTGGLKPDSLEGFSQGVIDTVKLLIRSDESALQYGMRIRKNPVALAIWTAQTVFEEKLLVERTRWNKRRGKAISGQSDTYPCPLLRRDMHGDECADIARLVDDYADDASHAALRYLDRDRCMRCVKHRRGATESSSLIPQQSAQ